MRGSLVKIIFFVGLLSLQFTKVTSADMTTSKIVSQNTWAATTLAFSSRDTGNDQTTNILFNLNGLKPGGYQVKTVRIKNDGAMKVAYKMKTEVTGGEQELCNALEIKILENWQTKYEGKLVNLNLNGRVETQGNEDWVIVLGLTTKESALANKTCNFAIHFQSESNGLFDQKRLENLVASGVW